MVSNLLVPNKRVFRIAVNYVKRREILPHLKFRCIFRKISSHLGISPQPSSYSCRMSSSDDTFNGFDTESNSSAPNLIILERVASASPRPASPPSSASAPLAAPEEGQSFESLEDLIQRLNEHAGPRGYAIVLARTKKNKDGNTRKAWLICDRGGRVREPRGQSRRHTASRAIACPFSMIAIREKESDIWFLEVVKSEHNHASSLAGAHPVHRKMAITAEVKDEISRQLTVQTAPSKVISSLRIPDLTTGINWDDPANPRVVNPMIKPRDIYNLKAQLRREALGPLTPIQALIRELDQSDDWLCQMQKNEEDRNQITHLFFVKGSSRTFLKSNYEVLIMDCTYKTNRYKMPLLIISGQTALHTNFYVAFCFMASETKFDYTWVLRQVKALYL